MLVATSILGHESDARFAGRRRETLAVACTDASKRRLRATTDAGTDVAIDLARGSFLAHGAVLDDDGERMVVVDRKPEQMVVVRLAPGAALLEQAVAIGNAFGNQHVVVEVVDGAIRIPIATSREFVLETVAALGLDGAAATVETVRPWPDAPPRFGAHAHHGPTLSLT